MSLSELIAHPVTSVVIGVLGTIASVVGAYLTISYSSSAANSAEAARIAANETRSQVKKISIHADLNSVLQLLDDIRRRIDSESWEFVSERCTQVRLLLAPIVRPYKDLFGEENASQLSELIGQMKLMSETAEKQRENGAKAISKAKLQKLVADFKEKVVLALAHVKEEFK